MQTKQAILPAIAPLFLLSIMFGLSDAKAGNATVSEHYLGADVGFSHSTDSSATNSIYYGEATSFKFNIQSMVYDSPAHATPALNTSEISATGRLDFGIYLQTQSWGLKKVFGTPAGDPTPNLSDPAIQAENYQRHVKWFHDTHGYNPAAAAYQGGGASPSTTGMLFDYMLAGRTSSMSAYNNDAASWVGDSASNGTKYYKVTTRFGDEADGLNNAMDVLENAINADGWYRDFNHWHTNPRFEDTLHDFFEAASNKFDAHNDKRIVPVGSGTHAQQAWYRSIVSTSLTDTGSSIDVDVTYTVPSWMQTTWTWDGFTSKPVDAFVKPASITIDTSGTSLSGSDLMTSGATSLRKIGADKFVVEVPFNKISELVTVTLSATASPNYTNDNLPVISLIAEDASHDWTITTDQDTKLVLFSLPAGVALSEIEPAGSTAAEQVKSPYRDNISSTTHSFNLDKSTSFDYYIGVITDQGQSILEQLVVKTAIAGDYNSDGTVDAADYTAWSSSFGSTTNLASDGNHNGVVDAADYTVWRDNLSVVITTAVPEPNSILLLGFGGLFGSRFPRRGR